MKTLQKWYESSCNGDWEHSYGIRIETTDNPGWILIVDLAQTPLSGHSCDRVDQSVDGSWMSAKSDGIKFVAACDPGSLERVIDYFIEFSTFESKWQPPI
ncbi:Imm53 family immunity protein [Kitasatospora sp. NPDC048286]|uniref:Imm53 family immunity protein n=1 Tax=Kitasatospora sp. NPDC048286 TaxID=3364047 RepID=UPI00371C0108